MYRFLVVVTFFIVSVAVMPVYGFNLVRQELTVDNHSVQLMVPEGMRVQFMAKMDEPRFMTLGPENELLIGSAGSSIHRLRFPYTSVETLVSLPGRNHSVAFRDNTLYVAETGGLYSTPYAGNATVPVAGDFNLVKALPSLTGGHWSRTVITGPDNRLYIGIGISGNCSDEYLSLSYPFEKRRGGVFVLDETGDQLSLKPHASGLRNPIGLAYHPVSREMYATNAGPDNLGYDLPPEVLARLGDGSFHGMPWFQYYNGAFRSGECASSIPPRPASAATQPAATFEARSTPEGIVFVTDTRLEPSLMHDALVAIHGSWATLPGKGSESRRPPKIVRVKFADGQPAGVEDLVTGFQRPDGSRFARPCGMLMGPDGNLYFTSDGGEVTGLFRLTPIPPGGISTAAVSHLLLNGDT